MSLKKVAYALVMLGAINWGLIGILEYNFVGELLGNWPSLVRILYGLVGVSAVYMMTKPHA